MAKALNVLFMITKEKISLLWEHHCNVQDNYAAMLPMHGSEDFWSIKIASSPDQDEGEVLSDYTKFSDIDIHKLLSIRELIITKQQNEQVTTWMEKILRYTEINLRSLDNKVASLKNKESFCWHLLSLLLDHYFISNDIRFLNAAMKLFDRKWMHSVKLLSTRANNDVCQALAVRGYMLIEYAIHNLKNDR